MAQPIVIGTYCSDFTIDQPKDGNDYYYYKAVSNGKDYYIATARATDGQTAVDASTATTIRIIPSPFVVPVNGRVEDTNTSSNYDFNFREFRFKLTWKSSFTPDFSDSTSVIASNRRRYLEWKNHNDTTGTTGGLYTDTKKDRFVQLSADDDMVNNIKFGTSALKDSSIFAPPSTATGTFSIINNTGLAPTIINKDTVLNFNATRQSPVIQTRSANLKYLILKSDLDNMSTGAVTAGKTLRYLIYNNNRFELVDLYDPDVTTPIIQRTAYRLAKDTRSNLPDTVSFSGGNGSGSASLGAAPTQSWSIDVYTSSSTNVPLTVAGSGSTAYPTGFAESSSFIKNSSTVFSRLSTAGVFTASKFSTAVANKPASSDGDITTHYLTDPQDLILTFDANELEYADLTNNFAGTGISTSLNANQIQFVFTNQLVDKAVEELFTNLSVTLLKVQTASPIPQVNSAQGNTNFLGFENVSPSATPAVVTSLAGTGQAHVGTGTTDVELIIRDYYKFFNPPRATQFKFYDLGKGTEYLWQIRLPSNSVDTYAYVGVDGGSIKYYPSNYIKQDTRGWIMEYDASTTPPGVRMKWAQGGATTGNDYVGIIQPSAAITDSAPYRINKSLVSRTQAAIFNCIMCSSIDSSGACLPIISGAYDGTNRPPAGRPGGAATSISVTMATGVSPTVQTSTAFRFSTINGQIFGFTVTQVPGGTIIGPAGSGVFSPGAQQASFFSSPVPSPAPGIVLDFVITQADGVISRENIARKAVFIRARDPDATGNYQYLKYTTAGTNRLELISTNRPSDDDGFAWILFRPAVSPAGAAFPTPRRVILYSAYTSGSPSATRVNNRYVQANGSLSTSGTAQIFNLSGLSDTGVDGIVNTSSLF